MTTPVRIEAARPQHPLHHLDQTGQLSFTVSTDLQLKGILVHSIAPTNYPNLSEKIWNACTPSFASKLTSVDFCLPKGRPVDLVCVYLRLWTEPAYQGKPGTGMQACRRGLMDKAHPS